MRQARVFVSGELAGHLEERDRTTCFTYDAAWLARPGARPVSLTIPLGPEPHEARGLHPFFENLLPEGWLLELSTVKLRIPKDDAFGLLLATCADCIGEVEIQPVETNP